MDEILKTYFSWFCATLYVLFRVAGGARDWNYPITVQSEGREGSGARIVLTCEDGENMFTTGGERAQAGYGQTALNGGFFLACVCILYVFSIGLGQFLLLICQLSCPHLI